MKKNNNTMKNSFPYLILLIVIVGTITFFNYNKYEVNKLTTGELLQEIDKGTITEITITPKASESGYYIEGKLKSYKELEYFKTFVISADIENVTTYAKENNISVYKQNKDAGGMSILLIIINLVPYVFLAGLVYFIFTKLGAGNNRSMDFGRSKAKLASEGTVKFKDVAGLK